LPKERLAKWKSAIAAAGAMVGLALASCSASAATVRPAAATKRLAAASAQCAADKAAGTVKFASPFGYDASAGIIDVYAALKLGYFSDLCLKVDFIDTPLDESAPALVSSGAAQVTGEGSAADAMVPEVDGSNFVAISTYGDISDYALLTVKGITKLTQLEGKVLAYHTTLPVVLSEMLAKAGVDASKVRMVNDQSYNPLLLVHGSFSALQAYQSNEPITLRAAHASFTTWTPAQFGVPGTFNVQVVNRSWLAAHPGAVANFLRAELHAFDYCAVHVAFCVGLMAKAQGPSYSEAHGEAEWRFESALALHHHLAGAGVGVQTTAEWAPEAKALLNYKLVHKAVALDRVEDTSLAASLYHGADLIWP
jgi:NitT/TauT family transport system substrate-binding protein